VRDPVIFRNSISLESFIAKSAFCCSHVSTAPVAFLAGAMGLSLLSKTAAQLA
jgi:hypothetical protein